MLEVGYSQSGTDLEEEVRRYIHGSGGEITFVLVVDIKYIDARFPSGISNLVDISDAKSLATDSEAPIPYTDSQPASH